MNIIFIDDPVLHGDSLFRVEVGSKEKIIVVAVIRGRKITRHRRPFSPRQFQYPLLVCPYPSPQCIGILYDQHLLPVKPQRSVSNITQLPVNDSRTYNEKNGYSKLENNQRIP